MTDSEDASWVLLTNDDGQDSPALQPLVNELMAISDVSIVVPSREYSWSSKTMTRFGTVELNTAERDGFNYIAATGSPADCANIGIHNLRKTKPSVLVSGINIGANAGLAYLLSSGTIGAATEGMLSGIPAVALSLELSREDYAGWRLNRNLDKLSETWLAAAQVAVDIVSEVLNSGLPTEASVLSVNMPSGVTTKTPRKFAKLTDASYGSFFSNDDSCLYKYNADGLQVIEKGAISSEGSGDLQTLAEGKVAITPLRFDLNLEPTTDDRCRFEKGM